jgi:hypothetical protein
MPAQPAQWDPGWVCSAGPGQDGKAELWFAVFDSAWTLMGAAPAQAYPRLLWRAGRLVLDYSPVLITIRRGGVYEHGVICVVMPGARQYRPMWRIALDPGRPRHKLKPGDTMTVVDGWIALNPEPAADEAGDHLRAGGRQG